MKKPIADQEERRVVTLPLEIRTKEDGTPEAFVGTAIVFNQRSQNLGGFVEVIAPEAVNGADMSDVLGLFNHDHNIILGRSSAGTLSITVTDTDVRYEIPYDAEDDDHRRVMRKIQKGEVRGSSFAFRIAPNGDRWDEDADGVFVRTVTRFSGVYDMSPVARPAYLQTSAAKRSLEEYKASKEQEEKEEDQEDPKVQEQEEREAETEKVNNQIQLNIRKRKIQILKLKQK